MIDIKRLSTEDTDFWPQIKQLVAWEAVSDSQIFDTVNTILGSVRERGDAALIEYTKQFDQLEVNSYG